MIDPDDNEETKRAHHEGDVEAQADRVAAELVAEHLGGSIRSDVYALTVAVVSKAYLLGQLEARESVLPVWSEYLTEEQIAASRRGDAA